MGKKLELNTAVKATFKDGTTKEYPSIEEASKETGISVSAIKIRANKPGCGGKDKTLFEWCDDHTARHYRAKKSRSKGSGLETEVVNKLKALGYDEVCRSANESKRLDNSKVDIADPSGQLPIAIQCKCYQHLPNYFKIREECPDPREFVLIWKKSAEGGINSPGTVAIIDWDFFFELFKNYHK